MNIVQRRCGERTADSYLSSYAGGEMLTIVKGEDLLSAVISSLEVASSSSSEWSLFVDADVRLYDGALSLVEEKVSSLPEDVYQAGFAFDDRFIDRPVFGVHVHRNIYTKKSLHWFKEFATNGPKAESKNMKLFIKEQGFRSVNFNQAIGSHDYAQYYRDIFFKFVIRGVRHRKRLRTYIDHIKGNSSSDMDCTVALAGLSHSVQFPPTLHCDRNLPEIIELWEGLGIAEKPAMESVADEFDRKVVRLVEIFEFPKISEA